MFKHGITIVLENSFFNYLIHQYLAMKRYLYILGVLFWISCDNRNSEIQGTTNPDEQTDVAKMVSMTDDSTSTKKDSSTHPKYHHTKSITSSHKFNVRADDQSTQINLSSEDLFEHDQSELRPQAQKELEKVASVIKEKGENTVIITGYPDVNSQQSTNNLPLSMKRAVAVKKWLVSNGLTSYDLQVEGQNSQEKSNAVNSLKSRSVKIVIIKK